MTALDSMGASAVDDFLDLNISSNMSKELEDYDQYLVGNYIWVYISPILLVVGTFGNILSIIVLLRKQMRRSTTMFYLTCLSFGDLFTLYTGLLRYWVRRAFDVDLRHLSDASCKIHTFLVYVSLDFTVWILVSVTVDRCLSVSMPFKSKRICSLKRSKLVVCILLFLLFLKNIHFLWQLQLVNTWEFRCDATTEPIYHFYRYIWPWIDFSTFCLIPFSIMIVCNVKIIYEMVASERKLNAHKCAYTNHAPAPIKLTSNISFLGQSGVSVQSSTGPSQQELDNGTSINNKAQSGTLTKSKYHRIPSLTAMLLSVNCVFLVTTSPIQAFLIGEEYWFPTKTTEEIAWHNFWWATVNILQYLNNAIHFFLYCLTGPRFRHELKSMFVRTNKVAVVAEPSQTVM